MQQKYVVSLDELTPRPVEGLPTVKLSYAIRPETVGSKNFSVNHVIYPPRMGSAVHAHQEEGWVVLRGQGFLKVEGQKYPFKARDLLYVPADVPHQVVNTGDEPLEILAITAPPINFETDLKVIEPFDPARHLS
jgi:mannose-6-phosphate isomerase-like protein (cupin superfamily)